MIDPGRNVTLNSGEVKRLRLEYIETLDSVCLQAGVLWSFLQRSRDKPERIDEWISRGEVIREGINRQLVGFHKVPGAALEVKVGET
jgi:hypothetical protein